ncbi:MAG: TVP38/TMEM64 family protein [Nanoarchaeota archaeon]
MKLHHRMMHFRPKPLDAKVIRNGLIVIFFLSIAAIIFSIGLSPVKTPEDLAGRIGEFGIWGPFLVVLLVIIETVITPLPGVLIAIASGFTFGPIWGAVYTYIGGLIGCLIAFYLSRRFGRPLIEGLFSKRTIDKYDLFFTKKGRFFLWISYAIPVFPSDVLAYLAGLSDLKWKDFFLIVAIMSIPSAILLNYFGARIASLSVVEVLVIAAVAYGVLFGIGFLMYRALQRQIS